MTLTIEKIADDFITSDFAKHNVYTHMQLGFPMPIRYKDKLAVGFYLHKLVCTKEQITLSQPRFKVILSYPSERIIYFSELEYEKYSESECVIEAEKADNLAFSFEHMYEACDEAAEFYDEYGKLPDITLKKYYELLENNLHGLFPDEWYGGLYDSISSL